MKNTKSDAPNIPHRIYYYCPFLPLVSSRRLQKPPDYTFFLDEQPSVSRTTPLNFRSPFTTSTTFVVALPPHSIYHFSSRSLHAVLPVDPWISPEPSFPMDRYKPTTNHPRERSLFFLTPLWTPFQIQFLFVYPALPATLSGSTRDPFERRDVFRCNSPAILPDPILPIFLVSSSSSPSGYLLDELAYDSSSRQLQRTPLEITYVNVEPTLTCTRSRAYTSCHC